ncbi:hypothetical protein HK098_004615 [Nowakowskiella sp. JEL0407]|nr:hypothetical protein HK098_004615 [Nowakowskiella sp. JEL0407]
MDDILPWKWIPNWYTFIVSRNEIRRKEASAALSPELKWLTKVSIAGGVSGFMAGCYLDGSKRSLQFLAENAHRLPKTVQGWYFYHKYKNYEVVDAAFRGGLRQSVKFGGMSMLFCSIEQILETVTGRESFLNTTGAGIISALLFSRANDLSLQYTKYAVRYGIIGTAAMGLIGDSYGFFTGYSLKYPERKREDIISEIFFQTPPKQIGYKLPSLSPPTSKIL